MIRPVVAGLIAAPRWFERDVAMQGVTRRRAPWVRVVGLTAAVAVAGALAACTSAKSGGGSGGAPSRSGSASSATVPAPTDPAPSTSSSTPAVITTSVVRAHRVSPSAPVTVTIAHGTLTRVVMTNGAGKQVRGAFDAGRVSWHNTEDLGYSKTYRIVATGKNAEGTPVTRREKLTTVTPDNQTAVSMDRMGDYPLDDDKYGVAIVPELYFDENISTPAAKAAAIKAVTVTTTPHVDGQWAWQDDNRALYRPEHYWPSGTKVTIAAKIYGVQLGDGLYGQADQTRSFTIGRKQETVAIDSAPKAVNKVRVYNAKGRVIRTMNTSMGEHDGETVNGQYINFYTLDGTYTVLGHEQPAKMCSASYGLPANAPGGYACENIYNATKISTDGIYLHELLTTIYAQDNGYDVSHGCLNLNADNSLWFFNHSMIGDPVVIHGKKQAPKLSIDEGGAWTIPWDKWVKGQLH